MCISKEGRKDYSATKRFPKVKLSKHNAYLCSVVKAAETENLMFRAALLWRRFFLLTRARCTTRNQSSVRVPGCGIMRTLN